MYCTPCRAIYGPLGVNARSVVGPVSKYVAGPLVSGCSNFKKDVLKGHNSSDGHKELIKYEVKINEAKIV